MCIPVKDILSKQISSERCEKIMQEFLSEGYSVRKFDPVGQDDIGAGCGQLWFTQEWMKAGK